MFQLYETQRKALGDELQNAVATATMQAKHSIESSTKWHIEKMGYLSQVTEEYAKLGYLDYNKHRWRQCGEFKNAHSYIRRLAKEMKRPFIVLNIEHCSQAYNQENQKYVGTRWASISMPNTLKLAPLYAHLEIVCQEHAAVRPVAPGLQIVTRDSKVSSRRTYNFRTTGPEYGEWGSVPEAPVHPLVTYFQQQVMTDPVVRRLLKLPME